MPIKILLLVGSLALTIGTGLQVAHWSRMDSGMDSQAIKPWHVLLWLFDPVVFKNDLPDEHPRLFDARALRRQRTGWVWLFAGAFLTTMATLADVLQTLAPTH